MFKLCVLLVLLFRAYGSVLYADRGHNVTLHCFHESASHLCWYKQVAGEQPQLISSFYKHAPNSNRFYNQFEGDGRFSVSAGEGFYHLNISDVRDSDSALYYCGHTSITVTEFFNGTFLVLKKSSRRSFLLQPASDSVNPGGSVTLNCTVQGGNSDREHSVYWFKRDSGNSHLGIMYIHTHSGSSQCVQSPESPAQSCVYSLSKRNVSMSDAGTYHCAVASCGDILFGKGTRLDVGEKHADTGSVSMFCMVATLLVSVILNIGLIGSLFKMSGGLHHDSAAESEARCSAPSAADAEVYRNADTLYYAALSVNLSKRSRSQRDQTWSECVYYSVRQ